MDLFILYVSTEMFPIIIMSNIYKLNLVESRGLVIKVNTKYPL